MREQVSEVSESASEMSERATENGVAAVRACALSGVEVDRRAPGRVVAHSLTLLRGHPDSRGGGPHLPSVRARVRVSWDQLFTVRFSVSVSVSLGLVLGLGLG